MNKLIIKDIRHMNLKLLPGYLAAFPSISSILKSWLYLAIRSDLEADPVTHDRGVHVVLCQVNGTNGFRQGTYLIYFDQD